MKNEQEKMESAQLEELKKSHVIADNKVSFGIEGLTKRKLKIGWYGINKNTMPYSGRLYPEDWNFEIRAAYGKEIAYFSTINADDPISVLDGINQIIKNCVRIQTKNGTIPSTNIYEIDRMWFLLTIRDYTMVERENPLILQERCPFKCSDTENSIELVASSLMYKPLTPFAEKYIDSVRGGFTVKTKGGDIHFRPSTIELAEIYKDWFMEQSPTTRDPRFATRFHMYVDETSDKTKYPESIIQNAYNNFYAISMEPKKFAIYMKIEQEINPTIEEKISYICPNCGKEVHTDLRFPGRFQDIFLIHDIDSEFL